MRRNSGGGGNPLDRRPRMGPLFPPEDTTFVVPLLSGAFRGLARPAEPSLRDSREATRNYEPGIRQHWHLSPGLKYPMSNTQLPSFKDLEIGCFLLVSGYSPFDVCTVCGSRLSVFVLRSVGRSLTSFLTDRLSSSPRGSKYQHAPRPCPLSMNGENKRSVSIKTDNVKLEAAPHYSVARRAGDLHRQVGDGVT
jgi:hypothetical protein